MVLLLVLFLRMMWEWFPSFWTCALFWVFVGVMEVKYTRRFKQVNWWSKSIALTGAGMNALVTLANDGRMPVLGKFHPMSVWVVGTGRHLLFFCDRFPFWKGNVIFSLGDFFIIGSIFLPLLFWLFRSKKPLNSAISSS
jgi:hypothetical protein